MKIIALLCLGALLALPFQVHAAAPSVSNVHAAQRPGTKLVDIYYDMVDPDTGGVSVTVAVSTNGGASFSLPATSFTGAVGVGVVTGNNRKIIWDAGTDWNGKFSANVRFQVTASDDTAPTGMVLIPAGSFTMGNCMEPSEGNSDELPLHTVYVSAFYMDRFDVTKALWDEVKAWSGSQGYGFDYEQYGTAADYPENAITWFDAAKWCNARSQKEGLTPCYYTDTGLMNVYKTGQVAPYVNWSACGYRLPTEAEWEKAARGGASGQRFPWGNTISWNQANYYGAPLSYDPNYGYAYDANSTGGFHPFFQGYTSPVTYFAPNGYGLYDMAGNVSQWCWDWYGAYSGSSETNPRGPASGSVRVLRGGSAMLGPEQCRTAHRFYQQPSFNNGDTGFRCVLTSDH